MYRSQIEYKKRFLECYFDICEKADLPKRLPSSNQLYRGININISSHASYVNSCKNFDNGDYQIYSLNIGYQVYSEKCVNNTIFIIAGVDDYYQVYYFDSIDYKSALNTITIFIQNMKNYDSDSAGTKRNAAECENLINPPVKWSRKNIEHYFENECRKRNLNYYTDDLIKPKNPNNSQKYNNKS